MEIIKDESKANKTIIVLKDGDILEIQTLQGNPVHIEIKCIDGIFLVDEVTVKRIREVKMEQEQLEILRQHNKNKKNS